MRGVVNSCFRLRQELPLYRYRTMEEVHFRFLAAAVLAAFSLAGLEAQTPLSAVPTAAPPEAESSHIDAAAQPPQNLLKPDESDPMVVRARENLLQIQKLINMGALPPLRLRKAQDDIQDALDMSILKKSLYSQDLLPEQVDQMVLVAQRMVIRRQRGMSEMQALVSAGIVSRSEAEMTSADLERAQRELEWAQSRATLIQQLAESLRLEKNIVSLESEARSHPEWAGKVYMKYDGKGNFTGADRLGIESAFTAKFSKRSPH